MVEVEGEGMAVGALGLVQATGLLEHIAEVVPGVGVVGRDRERAAHERDAFVAALLLVPQDAEEMQGVGLRRRTGELVQVGGFDTVQGPRAVAGDRDIRIAGGAAAIQQYLRAGLVDEFTLAISPVMFGGGARLFAGIGREVGVALVETLPSPRVTHARYAVHKP